MSEIGAISRASTGLLDIVADTVEHTHTAISSRVFDALGPLGLGVRSVHDGITRFSYRAVRTSLRGAGALAGAVADHHPRLRRLRPLETTAGVRVLSAASGIVGDRLADDHPCLDLGLEVRHEDGRPYPDAEGITSLRHADTLVVFVHGLCEDENSWQRRSRAHKAAERDEDLEAAHVVTHGQRLAHAHGMTPLYVRYNTGRRVHANGARLADALDHVVATWPAEVRRIVLVGHSMGGLVARSACHHAIAVEQDWVERVSNLVYLGTPHLGAPLARGVHGAARWLARLPETRGVTRLLDHRSDGVRDLTTGRIVAQARCRPGRGGAAGGDRPGAHAPARRAPPPAGRHDHPRPGSSRGPGPGRLPGPCRQRLGPHPHPGRRPGRRHRGAGRHRPLRSALGPRGGRPARRVAGALETPSRQRPRQRATGPGRRPADRLSLRS
jgi:hypothetical protein